jgi:hypothetical protein
VDDPHPRDVATLTACLGIAGVDDESVQPCVEALDVAQGRQVAPGPEERLLGRVLRPVGIAKDAIREGITAVDAGRHDRLERIVVAALGSLDELGLHRRLRVSARPSGRVTEYGAGPSANVQSALTGRQAGRTSGFGSMTSRTAPIRA